MTFFLHSYNLVKREQKLRIVFFQLTMGCSSSNATSNATASTSNITNFDVVVQQVKQTWPDVKNIDKLAQKIFAQ